MKINTLRGAIGVCLSLLAGTAAARAEMIPVSCENNVKLTYVGHQLRAASDSEGAVS